MPVKSGIYYTHFQGNDDNLPSIILIHGAGSNRLCWPANMRRMAGQKVITLDLPGHGRSENTRSKQSIPAYAAKIVDFLIDIAAFQVILIGHSMGGAIALTIAEQYPRLVNGLVLIASGAYFGVPPDLLSLMQNETGFSIAQQFLRDKAFSSKTPPSIIDLSIEPLQKIRPGVLYGDWKACAEFDMQENVHDIKIPTQIIVGAEDRITPLAHSHFLLDRMSKAHLQIIPEAGHMVALEQPNLLTTHIQTFIKEHVYTS